MKISHVVYYTILGFLQACTPPNVIDKYYIETSTKLLDEISLYSCHSEKAKAIIKTEGNVTSLEDEVPVITNPSLLERAVEAAKVAYDVVPDIPRVISSDKNQKPKEVEAVQVAEVEKFVNTGSTSAKASKRKSESQSTAETTTREDKNHKQESKTSLAENLGDKEKKLVIQEDEFSVETENSRIKAANERNPSATEKNLSPAVNVKNSVTAAEGLNPIQTAVENPVQAVEGVDSLQAAEGSSTDPATISGKKRKALLKKKVLRKAGLKGAKKRKTVFIITDPEESSWTDIPCIICSELIKVSAKRNENRERVDM